MNSQNQSVTRWTLDVSIIHDPGFSHRVKLRTLGRSGGWLDCGGIQWRGLGVPEPLLRDLLARIDAIVTEYMVNVYGVQGTFPPSPERR